MPQGRCGRTRRAERGQSIVEMALVLPVALLILALVVDAGQFIVGDINLNQVARASAAAAAYSADHGAGVINNETAAVDAAVLDQPGVSYGYCSGSPPYTPPCVVDTPTTVNPGAVQVQQVTVYQSVVPLVPLFPGMTVQATAAAAY